MKKLLIETTFRAFVTACSRLILLAVLSLCLTCAARAQTFLPFGDNYLPTFSFVENYTDTIVLGDFGYEQVPDTLLTISAKASMKGVVVEDLVAEGNSLSINTGYLQLDLPLADAEPSEASGYQVLTWTLTNTDPFTGEIVTIGTVVLRYNDKDLLVSLTANDTPGSYSIYAAFEAGSDETIENLPLIVTFNVGPYGLEESALYVNGTASTFDKTVGTGDDEQTFYGLGKVRLTGAIDAKLPTISVTYPKPVHNNDIPTITENPITVTGTCSDQYGVFSVDVQLIDGVNVGAFQPANVNGGVWSLADVHLVTPGTNKLIARCTDQDGHVATFTRVFKFSLQSNLTVTATGNAPGRIGADFFAPLNYDPALTAPKSITKHTDGERIVVTATPGPGTVFDGWTASKTLSLEQLASPRITFSHQPNLVLTAHFLINPFIPVKGRYNGLATGTGPENQGFFVVTLAPEGNFSGSLKVGTLQLNLKGKFSNTGHYTKQIKVGGVTYTVDLTLNVSGSGAEQITGTVVGGTVNMTISADRSPFNAKTNPAGQSGIFNVIIPPDAGQSALYPTGIGYGRVTVTTSGRARFVGRSGSGTAFNAAAQLSATGTWPFFSSLYGKRGFIAGIVTFDLADLTHDLIGPLFWIRPPGVKAVPVYPAGFSGQSTLLGAKFSQQPGQRLFLQGSNGAGIFSLSVPADATLPAVQITLDATLDTNNRLTIDPGLSSSIENVQATVNPRTGLFGGSFLEDRTQRSFAGIIVGPKLNRAAGLFRHGTQVGAMSIDPPTP